MNHSVSILPPLEEAAEEIAGRDNQVREGAERAEVSAQAGGAEPAR